MKRLILLVLFFIQAGGFVVFGQDKQTNTAGSDIAADAPYRMKKLNIYNQVNSIPLHIYVHWSSCLNCSNELMDIKVYLKNASDASFSNVLEFDSYTVSAFNSLITSRSLEDNTWGVQGFDASGYLKDDESTIRFTADGSLFGNEYVSIDQDYWYFTLNIPAEKLASYGDIIDIKVYFSLDWATDQEQYFRVFRYNDDLPKAPGWYRGDTHYHTMFTQNDVEFGLPLEGTKEAAKKIGLDWITVTDHSCDYDEFGSDMSDNWGRLGSFILDLNYSDSTLLFIRALEASIKNSAGEVVHALLYPSETSPFSCPFFLDGGGDVGATSNTVPQTLADLVSYNGFAYCAHPFAEVDALPFVINGGIWNLGDGGFPENDDPHPSAGTVICNDLAESTDLYSQNGQYLFENGLVGGEIWNNRKNLTTTDQENDPWNVTYSGSITSFAPMGASNSALHFYRFRQNLDVVDFLQKRSLSMKNIYPSIKNWKFFMSAGSDAHGSFNYSNTELTFGITGAINDNALGKLSTLTYCPNGMGYNGRKVLKALKYGNTILSDGPIITMGISTDGNSSTSEIYIGQDTVLTYQQLTNAKLVFDTYITPEFGNISLITLTGITKDSIYYYDLPVQTHQEYNLQSILTNLFGFIPNNQYFSIRASMNSIKYYGTLSTIYRQTYDTFFSITNPIWIKTSLVTSDNGISQPLDIVLRPNPVRDRFYINVAAYDNFVVKIYDINNKLVLDEKYTDRGINVKNLPSGFYLATFLSEHGVFNKKIIINH